MAKRENVDFLVSLLQPIPKFPAHVYEAMLTWLFKSEERTIEICAHTAYKDIQQAPLGGIGKMPERDKKVWREDIEKLIARCIEDLFTRKASEQEAYDAWHKETCEKMNAVSGEHKVSKWLKNGYTYGIAQKQLNMTIKNMLVMERWDNHLEPIKKHLHVPVDSFIMEAASDMLEIPIPCKNGGAGKYSNTGSNLDSKPWSQWDYNDYIKFQKELRKAVGCPMDWEFSAWNKTKTKRENSVKG